MLFPFNCKTPIFFCGLAFAALLLSEQVSCLAWASKIFSILLKRFLPFNDLGNYYTLNMLIQVNEHISPLNEHGFCRCTCLAKAYVMQLKQVPFKNLSEVTVWNCLAVYNACSCFVILIRYTYRKNILAGMISRFYLPKKSWKPKEEYLQSSSLVQQSNAFKLFIIVSHF